MLSTGPVENLLSNLWISLVSDIYYWPFCKVHISCAATIFNIINKLQEFLVIMGLYGDGDSPVGWPGDVSQNFQVPQKVL